MAAAQNRARRAPLLVLAALLAALVAAGGCGKHPWTTVKRTGYEWKDTLLDRKPTTETLFAEDDTSIVETNTYAADDLADAIDSKEFPKGSRLHVQPLRNLTDAADASPFGRVVADQLAARLSTYGYELTLAPPTTVAEVETESLAREITRAEDARKREEAKEQRGLLVAKPVEAELPPRPAILSGEYTTGQDVIYLTIRVTRVDDQVIIASHSWTLPNNENTRSLLPALAPKGDGMTPSIGTSLSGMPATTFN